MQISQLTLNLNVLLPENCIKFKIVLLSDKPDLMFRVFYTFIQTRELMIIIILIV